MSVRRKTLVGSPKRRKRPRGHRAPHAFGFELLEPRLALSSHPLITEFVANNISTLRDGNGVASDWIEIHNPTSQAINLAGWHLTDDAGNLDRWTFPAQPQSVLDPGEYLIVFASSQSVETYIDPAGYLHTDFALSDDGEYLALTDPANIIVHEYAPQFPRQLLNVSYGLLNNTSMVTLIGPAHQATAIVPTNGALDAPSASVAPAWTLPGFNDASWSTSAAGTGVGFDFGDDAPPGGANGTILPGLIGFDLTDADQNGVLDGTIFEGGPATWPTGEQPPRALDNTSTTKWLAFQATGAPYGFRFAGGLQHAVNAYTITSANDAATRDPYSWTLSGSNDGVNYTQIDTRSAQSFASRFQTKLYEFTNTTAYEYYRFDFKTKFGVTGLEADRPSANAIQMAEIELFNRNPIDFSPLIDMDVEAAWLPQQTSVYHRVQFNVDDPSALLSLSLELQYDDGIVVYLNGTRVASANAPATVPNFQSNATAQRDNAAALVPQTFDLTAHLGNLVAGTNVLAVHVLNIGDGSEDLLSRPQLFARTLVDDTPVEVYMPEPTPGALNINGYVGLVEPPQFSVERGFYNAPFPLTLASATPSAELYYTIDGSPPTPENGTLYTGPISISGTRAVRAQAFLDGYLSADSVTHTYLFINDIVRQNYQATLNAGFPASWGGVAADYGLDPDVIGNFDQFGNSLGSDLFGGIYAATIKNDLQAIPSLSIVLDIDDMFGPNGIYTNSTLEGFNWERPTSVELIYPDDTTGFQIDAGIQMHGGAFRRHDLSRKHSFRLVFKGIYEGNTKLDYAWFGEDAATSFDTIVLRMDSNDGYAWSSAGSAAQYARDEWGRRTQADLGHHASHGTRVHLYINGFYWGIYNPVERADASFAESYYGGDKSQWDAINDGSPVDGNLAAWNTLNSLSQAVSAASTEAARTDAYMKVLGLNPDGTDNPSFETYLDAFNYVDYLLLNFYGANVDWPHRNWYAARRQGPDSEGFFLHSWDYETALDLAGSSVNTNNLSASVEAAAPYSHLNASQEFRVLFGDRVHRALFNDGALASANSIARYQEIIQELQPVIVAESARWGDMHRSTPYTKVEWQAETQNVVNFLSNRHNIFLQQLRTAGLYPNVVAPTFSQHGGNVPAGFDVAITAPAGAIWYTLDGSDPRMLGGEISPTAVLYQGSPVVIPTTRTLRARVLSGGQWSALNEATFVTPANSIRITELHYNPAEYPGVADPQDMEFFELLNSGSETVNFAGVQIAGFADEPYTFADGLELNAGGRIIVAKNPAVFQFVYGPGHNVAPNGYGTSNLSNGGERVILRGPSGETLQDFDFADAAPWPAAADGGGPSLEIVNPLGDPTNPANWRASLYVGGSPGASGVPGDYDGNSVVDEADHVRWRAGYGLSVARGTAADGNSDGVVDTADYVVWRKGFAGTSAAAAVATAVLSEESGPNETAETADPRPTNAIDVIDLVLGGLFLQPDNDHVARSHVRSYRPTTAPVRVEDALLLTEQYADEQAGSSSSILATGKVLTSHDGERSETDKVFAELCGELLSSVYSGDGTNLDIAERDLAVVAL